METANLVLTGNQEITKEIILVDYNYDINKFLLDKDSKGRYFFYYNKKNKKLFFGIVNFINELKDEYINNDYIDESICNIKFKNNLFQIKFEEKIKEKSLNLLKDVYAKRNIKLIGDRNASLYYSVESKNFKYALPIVDKNLFMKSNKLIQEVLYDSSIIPSRLEKRKTFAKIVNQDGEYFISLTNEKMLNVDYRFLLNELFNMEYRPYFYEFFIDQNQTNHLKDCIKNEIYIEGKLYEVELLSLKEKDIINNTKGEVFKGEIMFSASPTRNISAYLIILQNKVEDSNISLIENIDYLIKDKANIINRKKRIENIFMEKLCPSNNFSSSINYETRVFNVGQGNWIHILIYEGRTLISKIIFDIGIGKNIDKKLRDSITKQACKEITGNYLFMLSHWDLDHIKGITELNKSQLEKTWIVPEIPDSAGLSAKRLAAFLIVDKNINSIFVSNSLNGETIFTNAYFDLGKGYGNGRWHQCKTYKNLDKNRKAVSYTAENNLGLIFVIKTNDKKMIFPGDCEYAQFPNHFINQKYDALVISHHGATIKHKNLEDLGFINSGKNNFAVVCVGRKHKNVNRNYPKKSHKDSITDLGYKIVETRSYTDVNNPCKYQLK